MKYNRVNIKRYLKFSVSLYVLFLSIPIDAPGGQCHEVYCPLKKVFLIKKAWASEQNNSVSEKSDKTNKNINNDEKSKNTIQEYSEEQEIIVTGSNIRGIGPSAGSPVISIGREEIFRSGYATAQQVIQSLPQNHNGGVSEDTRAGADLSANPTFNSSVNLRGLGNVSTLVLLNGRRMSGATTDGISPDISLIPTAAIERVEVLPDGASAVYGSDAVAGVVNFILKSDYQGSETHLRYGTATSGQPDEVQFSQTFGINWSGGSVLVSGEFYRRDNLPLRDRSFSKSADQRPRGGTDWRLINSIPGNILDPVNLQPIFAIPSGQNGQNLSVNELLPADQAINYFDPNQYGDVLPRQKRYGLFSRVQQSILNNIQVYGELFYAKRKYKYQGVDRGLILVVPETNAFYLDVFGDRSPLIVGYNFQLDRQDEVQKGDSRLINGTAGIEIDVDEDWQVRAFSSYSESKTSATGIGINNQELVKALSDSNPDTALNVFGDGSDNNPEVIAKIFSNRETIRYQRKLYENQLIADGKLINLPAGIMRSAVGAELNISELDSPSFETGRLKYRRHVAAVFGELFLPLFSSENGTDLLQALELSFSGRWEQYNDKQTAPIVLEKSTATTFNPKVGLRWVPTEKLTLKATYGTAFRAPSLTQLSTAKYVVYGNRNDPWSATGRSNVLLIQGGRADLKNEKSETWTISGEVEDLLHEGSTISLTYYNTKFRNRIANFESLEDMVANSEFYGEYVVRNPTSVQLQNACINATQLYAPTEACSIPEFVDIIIDVRDTNRAVTETDGIDFIINFPFEVDGVGLINSSININYILNFKQSPTSTASAMDVLDTRSNPVDFRGRASISWVPDDRWVLSLFGNYIDSYSDNISIPRRKVDSHATLDASVSYNTGNNGSKIINDTVLMISVLNIFNNKTPFVDDEWGYDSSVGDPIGRFISVSLNKSF